MSSNMPSLAAVIDQNGISAPSYSDILANLQESFQTIFGQDVYIAPDSQDGQLLAIFAKAISDANDAAIAAYNAYSPSTAVGAGLSSVVKINGIQRKVPTNSQAVVVVGGIAGTAINGGIIGDNLELGTQWALPSQIIIPNAGQLTTTATCLQFGAILAGAGTLTQIVTPTPGWQTVSNAYDAIPGAPLENDAQLRRRQQVSVSLPAESTLDSIIAGVWSIPGVQRVKGYENQTDVTDSNGFPPHSIAIVVGGGDVTAICQMIALKKSPGSVTTGNVSQIVLDPYGVPANINFWQLIDVPIYVQITIKPLINFNTGTSAYIQASMVEFINGLDIGETSYLNRLYSPANLSGDAATDATGLTQQQLDVLRDTYTILSIFQGTATPPTSAADIPVAFDQAIVTITANVTVVLSP